ncbi:MAG: KAP family NTPase, partial [bacterium]|nr:KAP family NTPase [bacterium]
MEKEDCLLRENFAVPDICALIDYHSKKESNISFAIDGEWGCGKSFVLEMVEEKLKAEKTDNGLEDRYVVFHYNCWEYDYYDEPIVAIVSMMIEQIDNYENIFPKGGKTKFKATIKTLAVLAVSCFNAQLEDKTHINFNDLIQNLKAAEDGNAELIKNVSDFDPLWEFKRALNLLKKQIAEIAQKRTVIFVVDELDRCLPEYAIKVLERLHHISEGVKNLITVIAVDRNRLLDSISNAFGYDIENSKTYMEKFVSFYYKLDKGIESNRIKEKYDNYLNLFGEIIFKNSSESKNSSKSGIIFNDYMFTLFKEIDIREQEHLIDKAKMIHSMVNESEKTNDKTEEDTDKSKGKTDKKYDLTVMYMELLITVFYSRYNVEVGNLYSALTNFNEQDNLEGFRKYYFQYLNYNEDAKTNLKIINDKDGAKQLLVWYAAFLKHETYLPKSSDGISSDTSKIKEKYGIDMEENLEFLR